MLMANRSTPDLSEILLVVVRNGYGEMTEAKITQLHSTFPEVDESSLLEILLSCDGSLSTAESLLFESFPNKKRKLNSSTKQANIHKLFGGTEPESLKSRNTTNVNKPVYLYSKEDVEQTIPYASIHYDFLPKDLSESLLKTILADTQGFKPQEFYLFGNKCVSNHTGKVYAAASAGQTLYYNGVKYHTRDQYSDSMTMAQVLIEDQVNKEIAERPRLPFQSEEPFQGKLAVCNKFNNKSNNLDWHSDRMTYIGPHCIIASYTLGATRDFRIRKQYNDTSDSKFNTIYAVPLPHNTLLVMHAGFQEEFKHSVSSTTEFVSHEISGPIRFNLTYRNYLKRYQENLPMCSRCGNQMDLRRSYKDPKTRGRYIWFCTSGYLGKVCNGFHYADFSKECLYTDNIDECSRWIAREDRAALKCFRESLIDKD